MVLIILLIICMLCAYCSQKQKQKTKQEHFYIDKTDLYNYDKSSVPFSNYDIDKLVHVTFPCSMKYGYASYNSPSQNGISNCAVIDCPNINNYDFTDVTCWKCCNYD